MLNLIKKELIQVLQGKDVSLVLFYNQEGDILWSYGREVGGKKVQEACALPLSIIERSIRDKTTLLEKNTYVNLDKGELSISAQRLNIKQILIYPVDRLFLYVDSGYEMDFSEAELGKIELIAKLFNEFIHSVTHCKTTKKGLSGRSKGIQRMTELLIKYAIEEDSVLILGDTGVGKTHIAELIHQHSDRPGNFVVVNTTSISEELFESEIFGHKKGSFTSAHADKKGLVDIADGGTLFFDEIAEVPVSFQTKLLRFIEEKKYRIVGDPVERKCDIRIIAATNKDLAAMIADKTFREDLFYRLNILSIHIPPLRDRKEDIWVLIEENTQFLKGKETDDTFYQELLNYHWPGNIRELFTILKRAGILCNSPITGNDVKKLLQENSPVIKAANGNSSGHQIIWEQFNQGKDFWQVIKEPFLSRELNKQEVRDVLESALARCGNKYVNMLELFNLNKKDYNQFIRFLYRNGLN